MIQKTEKVLDWMGRFRDDGNFLPVPRCLLQAEELTVSAALVYAAIADEDIDGDGVVRIQHKLISVKTGYKPTQIKKAIKELIAAELLEPEPERTGRANIYRLTVRLLPPVPQKRRDAKQKALEALSKQEEEHGAAPEACRDNVYYHDIHKGR